MLNYKTGSLDGSSRSRIPRRESRKSTQSRKLEASSPSLIKVYGFSALDMVEERHYGVIIGPLRLEQNPDDTAKNIFRLLNCVGIRCVDTAKISVNPEAGYSVVEFYHKAVEDYAIKVLKEVQSIMNLYDLRRLTDKPQHLRAERLSEQADGPGQELSSISEAVLARIQPAVKNDYTIVDGGALSMFKQTTVIPQNAARANEQHRVDNKVYQMVSISAISDDSDTQISFHRLQEDDERMADSAQTADTASCFSPARSSCWGNDDEDDDRGLNGDRPPVMLDAKTSTAQISPCFHSGLSFYVQNQKLFTNLKNVYFDIGDVLSRSPRTFRVMVGQYVCAFLNSGGGAVFFGVNRERKVRGLLLDNRMEDAVRLDIDSQIKLLKPLVPTSAYKVNFINVMDDTGHLVPDLRVLEVEVLPLEPPTMHYRFKSSAFVWDHGKVRELDQTDIFF